MAMKNKKSADREQQLEELWPGSRDQVWPRKTEKGWFKGPRALPLILALVNTKALRGDQDIQMTYLTLLSENRDEGLVEIKNEPEFAELAGFTSSPRGVRMWRERVRILQRLGLLRFYKRGSQEIGFVALVHPYDALDELRRAGKITDDGLWNLYRSKLRDAGALQPPEKSNVVRLPTKAGA